MLCRIPQCCTCGSFLWLFIWLFLQFGLQGETFLSCIDLWCIYLNCGCFFGAAIWTCVMAACCIHSSILLRWLVWKSNLTMLMSYFQCPNQSVVGQFTILWQPFSVHTYEAVINVCWHSVKTNPIPQHDATSTVMFTDISNNKVINPKFG